MIRSKKILSVVCALAMLLSMFSVFTVANAAGVAVTAEVVTDGKMTGDAVEIKFSYSGLTEASISGFQFALPIDADKINVDSITVEKSATFSSASAKYNKREGAVKFAFVDTSGETPITVAADDLCTVKFTLAADLTEALDLTVSELKITNKETAGEVVYISSDVAAGDNTVAAEVVNPTINAPEPCPVTVTATVVADGKATGDTVEIKFSYSGLAEASISGFQFALPIDADKIDVDSIVVEKSATYSSASAKYNKREGAIKFAFVDTSGETPITVAADDLCTVKFNLKADLGEDALKLLITELKITNKEAAGEVVYTSSDVGSGVVATIVNPTVNSGEPTSTPTPAPTVEPTVEPTTAPTEAPKPVELVVNYDDTVAAGAKVTVKPTKAAGMEYTGTMDIVVQVYDQYTGLAVGFVVYDDVAIDEEVVFYTNEGNEVSINAVDSISDTANLIDGSKLVAKKVVKPQ